jgi:anaerobic selenocysteine-containing dehydrogenase
MSLQATSAREVRFTRPYCGVGCGVFVSQPADRIIDVRGDPDLRADFGRPCTKGTTLNLAARPEGRSLYPEMRTGSTAARVRAVRDEVLDTCTDRFAEILRVHGPDAVAFYGCGQLLTEDYYVFNKLAKGLIGTHSLDTNSRLCMSSAVAGYRRTLGADAPPCTHGDIERAELLLIAGSNTAFAHPVLYRRIEDAQAAEWSKGLMQTGAPLESVRPWILASVSSPPKGAADRDRTVCNCFDMALSEIERNAADSRFLEQVRAARKCGASCGACLPEVKRIIASRSRGPAAA